MVAEHDSEGSF